MRRLLSRLRWLLFSRLSLRFWIQLLSLSFLQLHSITPCNHTHSPICCLWFDRLRFDFLVWISFLSFNFEFFFRSSWLHAVLSVCLFRSAQHEYINIMGVIIRASGYWYAKNMYFFDTNIMTSRAIHGAATFNNEDLIRKVRSYSDIWFRYSTWKQPWSILTPFHRRTCFKKWNAVFEYTDISIIHKKTKLNFHCSWSLSFFFFFSRRQIKYHLLISL